MAKVELPLPKLIVSPVLLASFSRTAAMVITQGPDSIKGCRSL